jgi:hypothetical protein
VFIDEQDIAIWESFANAFESALHDRLRRGGYTVLFWSHNAGESEFVLQEVVRSLAEFSDQILVTLLDETPIPNQLVDRVPIHLYQKIGRELDHRRVDDLIVCLYIVSKKKTKMETLLAPLVSAAAASKTIMKLPWLVQRC